MIQHFITSTKLSCAVLMNLIKLPLNEYKIRFHCWMWEIQWERNTDPIEQRNTDQDGYDIVFSTLLLIPIAKTSSALFLCQGYSYTLTFISPSDDNGESEIPLKLSCYMFKPLWHFSRQYLCPCLCRRPWWPYNTFIYDSISIISMATCFSSCRLRIAIS